MDSCNVVALHAFPLPTDRCHAFLRMTVRRLRRKQQSLLLCTDAKVRLVFSSSSATHTKCTHPPFPSSSTLLSAALSIGIPLRATEINVLTCDTVKMPSSSPARRHDIRGRSNSPIKRWTPSVSLLSRTLALFDPPLTLRYQGQRRHEVSHHTYLPVHLLIAVSALMPRSLLISLLESIRKHFLSSFLDHPSSYPQP
jgi:hypothetical protein